ncbi:hypothetical protein MACJ_002008 [Theileria orientalis]|uniref:BTB domain-containing protein n=1 Tax=Theileria orientalis TaxID=68886 RepID=A0A976M5E9_THEOR|nr:hypothetical protein MACJ_002008 [Theileria orientalis]
MLDPLVNLRLSELTGRNDINDDYTDMLLILRKPDEFFRTPFLDSDVVINVHTGVLRVASSYFNKAIDSLVEKRLKEGGHLNIGAPLKLVLDTKYPSVFQRIIYYIYKNDYQNMNEETRFLVPLYSESVRFDLTEMKNGVLRMIRSQASLEDLSHLASAAESAGELELASECGRILSDSAYAVLSSNLHLNFGLTAMRTFLSSDNLQLDEVETFATLCYYMDTNKNLHSPYSTNHLGKHEKDLVKTIRFCSMSPKALSEFRCDSVNTFLLDGALRILNKTQLKPRVFPWNDNDEYKTIKYNGLFPIMLVRSGKYQLTDLDHNSSNCKLVTPQVNKKVMSSYQAHTHGTEREGCEFFWAFQVSKTQNGKIGLGLTVISDQPIDELSRSVFSTMSKSRKIVFFYDFAQNKFKSGYIDNTSSTEIRSLWTYDSNMNRNVYKLKTGDIVHLRISVTFSCVTLQLSVVSSSFNEKFTIPISSKRTLGSLIKRAAILTSPFVMTYDVGDALVLPGLSSTFKF